MRRALLLLVPLLIGGVVIFFSCKKTSCEGCKGSKPPIAIAGPDQLITLPTDSITLDGSASNDPDGKISEWVWKKISGPASFNIVKTTTAKTIVRNLDTGVYHFELKVTDDKNLSATDTVQITVNNRPPVVNAGVDQTITLPTNTVNLDGSASTDPDNNITSYLWTKISGPSSTNISNANAIQTQVTSLVEGVYQFELKVTDAGGLLDRDTVKVFVLSPPVSGDVYVAGYAGGAAYWKNGTLVSLTNGNIRANANDIAISGSDVYVAGWENNGTKLEAKYWKNGIPVTLAGGSIATAIAVSGSDVYVAGYEYNDGTTFSTSVAKYWKNGIPIVLTDGSQRVKANGIAVSGDDVYVVGFEGGSPSNIKLARYWKNGTPVSLTNGTNWAEANDIAISGSDIYIAGSVGGEAVYWKNGNYVNLSGISNAFLAAYSVAVSGSDVYVAGMQDTMGGYADFGAATYWKNGIPNVLTSVISNAAAIAISGSDVYVAGVEQQKAMLWKNGTPFTLSYSGTANAIIVVK